MLKDLITKTRSYRRFKQEPAPTMADLESLITLARMAPAASNKQPWKYVLVQDPETLPKVFSCLKWAGYLTDWPGPSPQERPTAYIVFLNDTSISENGEIHLVDLGPGRPEHNPRRQGTGLWRLPAWVRGQAPLGGNLRRSPGAENRTSGSLGGSRRAGGAHQLRPGWRHPLLAGRG